MCSWLPVVCENNGFTSTWWPRLCWTASTPEATRWTASTLTNSMEQGCSCHSYFTTGGLPPISPPWRQPLETHDQFIFQLNTYDYSPYVTTSLTRGWVCRLQLLLGPRQRSHSQVRVPLDSRYFTLSVSRLAQPRGPDLRIYIPQEQGGPDTSPGTGFPFRRLLRLAGLLRRYSTPPPHGRVVLEKLLPPSMESEGLLRCWYESPVITIYVCMYVCIRGGPQKPALAPRPLKIYCASPFD
jgi:hypothetical protein